MGKGQSKDGKGRGTLSSVQKSLKLSTEEADSMLKSFFQMSQNSNAMTRQQFYTVIRQSAPGTEFDEQHWEVVFNMLDLNGDGTIDFYEFSIAMVHGSRLPLKKKIDYLFQMMDFDKDGSVSLEEMNKAMQTASKLANNAETVTLQEYFPSLVNKTSLTKKEFKKAMMTPKGRELMEAMGTVATEF